MRRGWLIVKQKCFQFMLETRMSCRMCSGKLFQTRGPAALKLRSPKLLCIRRTKHMLAAAERSGRRSVSVTSCVISWLCQRLVHQTCTQSQLDIQIILKLCSFLQILSIYTAIRKLFSFSYSVNSYENTFPSGAIILQWQLALFG